MRRAPKTGTNLFAPQHHTGTGSKKNHDPKATTSRFLNDGKGFPAKPGLMARWRWNDGFGLMIRI